MEKDSKRNKTQIPLKHKNIFKHFIVFDIFFKQLVEIDKLVSLFDFPFVLVLCFFVKSSDESRWYYVSVFVPHS